MGEFLYRWSVVVIVLSGVALLVGVTFIKRGHREAHLRSMLVASGLAALFIVMYLTRIASGYSLHYAGPEAGRWPYYILLIAHTVLAALNLPLAAFALYNAWRGLRAAGNLQHIGTQPASTFFGRHRAWVRWTVPVWLFVAASGWVIYLVLERYGAVKGG